MEDDVREPKEKQLTVPAEGKGIGELVVSICGAKSKSSERQHCFSEFHMNIELRLLLPGV